MLVILVRISIYLIYSQYKLLLIAERSEIIQCGILSEIIICRRIAELLEEGSDQSGEGNKYGQRSNERSSVETVVITNDNIARISGITL